VLAPPVGGSLGEPRRFSATRGGIFYHPTIVDGPPGHKIFDHETFGRWSGDHTGAGAGVDLATPRYGCPRRFYTGDATEAFRFRRGLAAWSGEQLHVRAEAHCVPNGKSATAPQSPVVLDQLPVQR